MLGFLAATVMPSKQQSSLLEGWRHFTGILQSGSVKHELHVCAHGLHAGAQGEEHAGWQAGAQGLGAQDGGWQGCSQTGS